MGLGGQLLAKPSPMLLLFLSEAQRVASDITAKCFDQENKEVPRRAILDPVGL